MNFMIQHYFGTTERKQSHSYCETNPRVLTYARILILELIAQYFEILEIHL